MLTNTIPRCVRGRIYRYDMVSYYKKSFGKHARTYVGVFVKNSGMRKVFLTLALDGDNLIDSILQRPRCMVVVQAFEGTFTEVPRDDLLLYINYRYTSDLFKKMLSDPSYDPLSKPQRRKRVKARLSKK